MSVRECQPGTHAPEAGTYEQRGVLGTLTGVRVIVARGEVLPAVPRGCTWQMVEASSRARHH